MKFQSIFRREKKSLLLFRWYGGTILATPETSPLTTHDVKSQGTLTGYVDVTTDRLHKTHFRQSIMSCTNINEKHFVLVQAYERSTSDT